MDPYIASLAYAYLLRARGKDVDTDIANALEGIGKAWRDEHAEVLRLRDEVAQLSGFDNYAEQKAYLAEMP